MKITEKQAWTLLSMLYGMNAHIDRHVENPYKSETDTRPTIRNPLRDTLTRWGLCEAIGSLEGGEYITPAIAASMENKIDEYAETKRVQVRWDYVWTNDERGDLQRMRWTASQAKSLEQGGK